jgi:hypothetical protein
MNQSVELTITIGGAVVMVCGGRDYVARDELFLSLNELHARLAFSRLVHGNCRGADQLAGEWAESRGVPLSIYPCLWDEGDTGPARNRRMLDDAKPALVIAFPGGSGTESAVYEARRRGIPVVRVHHSARNSPPEFQR